MFDTTDVSSSGLSDARRIDSMPLTIRSVSSMRVPIGALMLMRNCASSEAGKNSVPIRGRSPKDGATTRKRLPANVTTTEPTTRPRWPSAHSMSRW